MALDNTVSELIQRVRDITDEDNLTDVSDSLITRMLNMAQQELVRTLTRHYKNHFMREEIFTSSDMTTDTSGQSRVLKVADQSFGFAVNSVDGKTGSSWFPISQVPFQYTLGFDNTSSSGLPLSYAMQGQSIYLYPAPDAATTIRIRYQFRAPQLVASQGRITDYSSADNTVTLDTIGSDLSTSTDDLTAYVNIIDHLTGEIKATMQISGGIGSTNKTLTMASTITPSSRTEVYGYTLTGTLPTNISVDDYVCSADGTCVPLLAHDLTNYLVDMAGFKVKRKLGTVDGADFTEREEIMKAIKGMRFGRQHTKKIKRAQGLGGYSWQNFFRGN